MPPATLQKSEPEASQLACIGEPFTNSSYKRADHLLFITRSFAGRNENIQQYLLQHRGSCLLTAVHGPIRCLQIDSCQE